MSQKHISQPNNISIIAGGELKIGEHVTFGQNIDIKVIEDFSLGDYSHLGDDVRIRGRYVRIGSHLWHSRGLDVGGGGCDRMDSCLYIGDRCTIHDNHINIAECVRIGNDVGLSPAVTIYTHGFWWNHLWGWPAKFAGVVIHGRAIVGYRSLILPGIEIGAGAVIGAQSVVTKNVEMSTIVAGAPAREIGHIKTPNHWQRENKARQILEEYIEIAEYHGIDPDIEFDYPVVIVNKCVFNLETGWFKGKEDRETDDFRDAMRRYGIRFYSERPFRSALEWPT